MGSPEAGNAVHPTLTHQSHGKRTSVVSGAASGIGKELDHFLSVLTMNLVGTFLVAHQLSGNVSIWRRPSMYCSSTPGAIL